MSTPANPLANPFSAISPFPVPPQDALTQPTDANGNPIAGPYSNVYGSPQAAPAFVNTPNASQAAITGNIQNYVNQGGQQLNQEAQGNLAYEGALQNQYVGAENQALNQLAGTPGYTPGEANQINTNYSQYNTSPEALNSEFLTPGEQSGIAGDPNAPVSAASTGTAAEGAFLNQEQAQLGSTLGSYQGELGSSTDAFKQGALGASSGLQGSVNQATGGLTSGLNQAQGKFSNLDSAVNDPSLAFDPNGTEKQITDAQVAQMATNAGEAVGNQYRTAEDQLQRQAAASGNASPLAIAAANARLQAQSASGVGSAESNAQIQALQAQQQQAAAIEQAREGAAFQGAGLKAGAATTEQSQAQAAAGLAGTQNLSAQELAGEENIAANEAAGQAGINSVGAYNTAALGAETTYGGQAQNAASAMEQQNYGAQSTAEQEAASRAATLGSNRQATQANVNNTGYSQGTGSAQLTGAGAQTVGNARIGGQNTYLNTVAGAGNQAQQGGQAAVGAQQNAFNTQASNLTSSTGNLGSYRNGKPSTVGEIAGVLGGIGSFASGVGKLSNTAKGGVFTEPTISRIAESGPEVVSSMGRYGGEKLVTEPTIALLGADEPESVIPLNSNPDNKTSTKMLSRGRYRNAA